MPGLPGRSLLPLLFFATGAAGLVYEVVWFRLLETIFGVTTLATSTVLAVFMGGLALGAHLASRRADAWKRPLRAYGVLEIALAIAALAVPWVLPLANRAFVLLYDALQPSFAVLTLLRLVASALVLLVPATLMGMTLPVLARAFARSGREGADVGLLYTINTAGALAGAAIAGFVLIPMIGLRASSMVAVGLNLLAGVPAFVLGSLAAKGAAPSVSEDAPATPAEAPKSSARAIARSLSAEPAARLRLLAALSGLCALAYQVFWTRALLLSIGNTVYAFTVILVTVLAGITIGGGLATFLLARRARPLVVLGITQLAVALVVVIATSAFDDFPRLFLALSERWGASWGGFLGASFALAAIGLLPATILLGMGLPLVLGEAVRASGGLAQEVGTLYSMNTWAGIVGSVLAGFVLIPLVGIRVGLLAMAGINLATGAFALLGSGGAESLRSRPKLAQRPFAVTAACAAAFLLLVFLLPPWNPDELTSGLHTSGRAGERGADPSERIVFYEEGIAATVSVKRRGRDFKLQVNGRTEATSVGDIKTNTMLGSLPLLLRPEAQSALVIGLGSGVTLAGVVPHPLKSIDCVELSGEVVEASRLFTAVSGDATRDPRVAMRAEDGRNHLLLTRKKYDVIISQPSNLWAAGVGNLFTHEFFELCRDHLTEDGVLCQWIQGYSVSKSSLRSILFTLSQVFPSVDLWVGEWSDILVTASMRELPISVASLGDAFGETKIHSSLQRAGVPDVAILLSHHMMDTDAVRRFAQGARLHTDDNRLIEFGEPKSLVQGTATPQSQDLLAWQTDVTNRLGDIPLEEEAAASTVGRLPSAVAARRLEIEGRAKEAAGHGGEALELLQRAMDLYPEDLAIRRNLGRLHVHWGVDLARRGDYAGAHDHFDRAAHVDKASPESAGNLGLLAMLGGADEEAMRWTNRALQLDPENETYYAQRADIHRRARRWADSRADAESALALYKDHVPSILLLAEALAAMNDPEGADRELQRARRLGADPEEMQRIKKLVRQDG